MKQRRQAARTRRTIRRTGKSGPGGGSSLVKVPYKYYSSIKLFYLSIASDYSSKHFWCSLLSTSFMYLTHML